MSQNVVLLLCLGALLLALIAVVIDRLNFPQRRFRAKNVEVDLDDHMPSRDRLGAHIVDFGPDDEDE